MESLLGSRLTSVGNARRKKIMNQNKTFSFFCLKNSLIQPISLSPAILGKVFFNVKLFNLLKGGEKSMGRRNDDRSNSKNSNNKANKASRNNRANQKNPNHSKSKGKK